MTTNNDLRVEQLDELGTEDHPFGYVVFDDGLKLSYAPGTSGMGNPFGLFPLRGPVRPTGRHYKIASDYLLAKIAPITT